MPTSKPTKTTQQIAVSVDAWNKARKMAGLRKAKGHEKADLGDVATEAILDSWIKIPIEVREFLDQSEPTEAPAV